MFCFCRSFCPPNKCRLYSGLLSIPYFKILLFRSACRSDVFSESVTCILDYGQWWNCQLKFMLLKVLGILALIWPILDPSYVIFGPRLSQAYLLYVKTFQINFSWIKLFFRLKSIYSTTIKYSYWRPLLKNWRRNQFNNFYLKCT